MDTLTVTVEAIHTDGCLDRPRSGCATWRSDRQAGLWVKKRGKPQLLGIRAPLTQLVSISSLSNFCLSDPLIASGKTFRVDVRKRRLKVRTKVS